MYRLLEDIFFKKDILFLIFILEDIVRGPEGPLTISRIIYLTYPETHQGLWICIMYKYSILYD